MCFSRSCLFPGRRALPRILRGTGSPQQSRNSARWGEGDDVSGRHRCLSPTRSLPSRPHPVRRPRIPRALQREAAGKRESATTFAVSLLLPRGPFSSCFRRNRSRPGSRSHSGRTGRRRRVTVPSRFPSTTRFLETVSWDRASFPVRPALHPAFPCVGDRDCLYQEGFVKPSSTTTTTRVPGERRGTRPTRQYRTFKPVAILSESRTGLTQPLPCSPGGRVLPHRPRKVGEGPWNCRGPGRLWLGEFAGFASTSRSDDASPRRKEGDASNQAVPDLQTGSHPLGE